MICDASDTILRICTLLTFIWAFITPVVSHILIIWVDAFHNAYVCYGIPIKRVWTLLKTRIVRLIGISIMSSTRTMLNTFLTV